MVEFSWAIAWGDEVERPQFAFGAGSKELKALSQECFLEKDMIDVQNYEWDIDNPSGYRNRMGRYRSKREWNFMQRFLPKDEARILDVGGGSGRWAIPLVNLGHSVTVVDRSKEALELLKQHSLKLLETSKRTRLTSVQSDFMSFRSNNVYDMIIASESADHFEFVELLKKIQPLLCLNGLFLFTHKNKGSWRWTIRMARKVITQAPHHYYVDTPRYYIRELEVNGFEVLDKSGFMWTPFTVNSNSPFVTVFEKIEDALGLKHWIGQSPWVLFCAKKISR